MGHKIAINSEKQIIIVDQAAPNTQPGGVQGALFNLIYQSEGTPFAVKSPPTANAPKFNTKKIIIRKNIAIVSVVVKR